MGSALSTLVWGNPCVKRPRMHASFGLSAEVWSLTVVVAPASDAYHITFKVLNGHPLNSTPSNADV